jgi:hypothetical protein
MRGPPTYPKGDEMDKSDKAELKKMGKKPFIKMEKKDIAEAKKAKDKKKGGK